MNTFRQGKGNLARGVYGPEWKHVCWATSPGQAAAIVAALNAERFSTRLFHSLQNIVNNAAVQCDLRMDKATDIYAVPLGDIEQARELISEATL